MMAAVEEENHARPGEYVRQKHEKIRVVKDTLSKEARKEIREKMPKRRQIEERKNQNQEDLNTRVDTQRNEEQRLPKRLQRLKPCPECSGELM